MELAYKSTQEMRESQSSKTDADAAFDESWVLAELIALGPQALIEQVACVDNRLDSAGEHPPAWQILGNGQAQRRVIVLIEALIWIKTDGG